MYKFATRSRPHKFFAALDNIQKYAQHDDYMIAVTADFDDETMFNDEVKARAELYDKVVIWYGTSTDKVNAINRDMQFIKDWDILINMSDDMEFIKYGFDKEIIKDFETFRSLDLLLHYPDQKAWFAMCTMAIMGKDYFYRDGYIYNPIYKSLFCDNEQMEVAKMRGRYKYIKKRLFNHNNPMHGLAEKDVLHLKTIADFKEDKATFEKRKADNFK
jgi:hypothetical protein